MNVANTWWIGIHLNLLASIAAATSTSDGPSGKRLNTSLSVGFRSR